MIAKNIQIIEYPNGHKIAELLELSARDLYGFDAADDQEAREGLDKYFKGE